MQSKLISIVTTFRNEEKNLAELIKQIQASLGQTDYPYEIILVNDDSLDKSMEILQEFTSKDPRIKVLTTSRRFGVYECMFAGFAYAKGEAIIYLEADLQDPPELIPQIIHKWANEKADIVHTTRKERLGESYLKMKLTGIAYMIINYIAEVPIPINTGDYKLISRRAMDQILNLKEYDPYFRGLISWVGFNQVQIFYTRNPRFSGTSQRGIFTVEPLKVFLSAITSFSNFPMFSVFISSFLLILSSVFIFLMSLSTYFFETKLESYFVLGLGVLAVALILFYMGVQNLYLARIFRQVRGRPPYIIKEKINF